MAKVIIGGAVVLILFGTGAYVLTGAASVTALIPAIFGALLLIAGILALKEQRRKPALFGAMALALLGFLGSAGGLAQIPALLGGGEVARPTAVIVQAIMAVICGALVIFCLKSLIAGRRGRAA